VYSDAMLAAFYPALLTLLAVSTLVSVVERNILEASLMRAPRRRHEWKALLRSLPSEEKPSAEYLLTYMPLGDLISMPVSKVGEAVRLARVARKGTSWSNKVPTELFLDAVVPYASVTEPRQSMRSEFQKRYLPLVLSTKTPGEAALRINKTLFKDYKVSYNTHRLRTDQSPPETIAQGMATCTGLSIMLVDALRAVGVPSRLAGIPSWPGRGGNHTWVEVWSEGSWHYMGAAEPDEKGLDHGWFSEEAGRVPGTNPMETIYAVSYRPTGTTFPLIWDPGNGVPAENVTSRYRLNLAKVVARLNIEVRMHGERVVADIVATKVTTGDRCLIGKSYGPHDDVNRYLSTTVQENETYEIEVTYRGQSIKRRLKAVGDEIIRIELGDHH
jgi:transglutaminase-like putative cysteine protease